jgi:hypothetical protein
MFVLEAPSFVVPYVYEKPPKEMFKDFNESVKKIEIDLKEKDKEKKKENDKEEKDEKEKGKEEETEKEKEEETEKEKEKVEKEKEKEEKEKESDADEDMDEEKEAEVKKPSGSYFESSLGKFIVDLGMNMVQEMVQQDLLKEVTKKSQKDKSVAIMRSIASLKANLVTVLNLIVGNIMVEFTKI